MDFIEPTPVPDLKSLERVGVSAGVVKRMGRAELACLIAAFLVDFRSEEVELFKEYRGCLAEALFEAGVLKGWRLVGEDPIVNREHFLAIAMERIRIQGMELKATEKLLRIFMNCLENDHSLEISPLAMRQVIA